MRLIESNSSLPYLFQLSFMHLDTHKKPQKKIKGFLVVPYTSTLGRLNVLMKPQLSYVIKKTRFLYLLPPAEKACVQFLFSQKTSIGTRKK